MADAFIDHEKITRVEVIDHRKNAPTFGRTFVAWNISAGIAVQDDGRTLKVFVTDPKIADQR